MTLFGYLSRVSMLPTAVFLVVPGMLYYFNRGEWGGDMLPLMLSGGAWLLTVAIAAALYPFLGSKGPVVANCMFLVGLIILASDVFAPVQLGVLDGQALRSDEPLLYTVIEIVIAVVITAVFLRALARNANWPGQLSVIGLLSGLLLFLLSIQSTQGIGRVDRLLDEQSERPNVYHIHLDAMQTDYFRRYLKTDAREKEFDGFVLYENNISNYPFTGASVASYLTGTIYSRGRYDKWLDRAADGLPAALRGDGYYLSFYGKKRAIDTSGFDQVDDAHDLVRQKAKVRHPQIVDFVRLWSARLAPNFVTNNALLLGMEFGTAVQAFVNDDGGKKEIVPLTISAGIEPFSGVLMLRKLIDDEGERASHGEYVLAQVLIPHAPYVIGAGCELRGKHENAKWAYYEQIICTGNLLRELIALLKRLDRYDKSVIVFHGDHGAGWAGMITEDGGFEYPEGTNVQAPLFRNWDKEQVISRARALLMVKLPGAKGPLRYSAFDSQLADIYPTVLAAVDLPYSEGDGVDLSESRDESVRRTRHFYLFTPERAAFKNMAVYGATTLSGAIPLALRRVGNI